MNIILRLCSIFRSVRSDRLSSQLHSTSQSAQFDRGRVKYNAWNRRKDRDYLYHPARESVPMHSDMNFAFQYPIFGPEIQCPHCRQTIPALTLTDTYLCSRHGAFEADPKTGELVHLQSSRNWCLWNGEWYRQHTHPDGIRFEIHDALDKLYTQGYRATKVTIAERYRELIGSYLDRHHPWMGNPDRPTPRLFGLPVEFSPLPSDEPCWQVINFELEKEPGIPVQYPYFRMSP